MLQAILFDLDGTLADTDPIHFRIWQQLLRSHQIEIDATSYQQHISGRLNADIMADLLPHLAAEAQVQFAVDKEARFRELAVNELRPLAGLLPLLAWIEQQGLKTAVVTNAPRQNAAFMLETLNLTQRFRTVILAGELPKGKPDPLPYQEAMRQLQVQPAQTLAFEDSPSGLRSAVAAQVTTVGMATTHTPESLYALGADLVVTDFTDERLKQFGLLTAAQ
ncbi:HAD family hydrolase [Almyronema epifaneia]|uniref:HAD family hydrolase n=1 Tax=Almyronema epifaneia S1 TaxID=2991925 RepID=A0ABW6ICW4_9CYAN